MSLSVRSFFGVLLLVGLTSACTGQARFPTEYYIHEGHFTDLQIEAIQAAFRAWEPTIRESSQKFDFEFRYMGEIRAEINPWDDLHIIRRSPNVQPPELAEAHLFVSNKNGSVFFTPAGDIRVREDLFIHDDQAGNFSFGAGGMQNFSLHDISCFQAVITHEVGHIIGIGHSKTRGDIMFPFQKQANCQNFGLSEGDAHAVETFFKKYKSYLVF